MRILFIGCVESSYTFLESILKNRVNVVGVITKRSSVINSDFADITPLCRQYCIPLHYVQSINEDDSVQFINECNPDIGYCFGWSQLIDERIINMFPMGLVGYHPAELPNNRGRHPIIWALALGLNRTASTFFMLEKTADTGAIVSQEVVDIRYEDDARTLMNKLLTIGAKQVVKLTNDLATDSVTRISQVGCAGNVWRKRSAVDGQIDWRMSSRSIYNLVRALARPYVGAHFVYLQNEIKVWKVREIIDDTNKYINIEPGKVLNVLDTSIVVKAGENMIELLEYEPFDISEGDYL